MALQFSTTARNNLLDSLETSVGVSGIVKIYSGSVPATCATAASGTNLVTWNLGSDWAANASGGSKSFSATPLVANAVATGTAGYFRLFATDGTTCHMQGTVTITGSGGDMTLDNTSINSGQNVQITSWTLTAPGA
jgi:hypothetical protein